MLTSGRASIPARREVESYEVVNAFGGVVLTVCMLLGRLEILMALALLSPAFWKR